MYSKMKETLIKEMELVNKATKSTIFKTAIDSLRAVENIEFDNDTEFFTAKMFYLGIYLGLSIDKGIIQRCIGNNNLID